MTNIQNICLIEIVTSVPDAEIWRDLKFVRCDDVIWTLGDFRFV